MKLITSIALASTILLNCAIANAVPFSCTPFKVVLEPTKKHDFKPDASHLEAGKLAYTLTGQVFPDGEGKITLASGATPRSTPWETLSELLAAYQAKNFKAVRGLYIPGPESDGVVTDLSSNPQWLPMMEKMKNPCILLAYQQGNRFLAYVRFQDGELKFVLPFTFELIEKQYLISPRLPDPNLPVNWNIALALVNFQMNPSEIIGK